MFAIDKKGTLWYTEFRKSERKRGETMFDYSKLRGRIIEQGMTNADVAAACEISKGTFSQKINNHSEFTQDEIVAICDILRIPRTSVHDYFFTAKV